MTSQQSKYDKAAHAITVRAWPPEISGQGLGIIGVFAVVALALWFFKPDITTALQRIMTRPEAVDTRQ